MSGPVEFRLFARKFTLDDLKVGIQPMRDGGEFYCPAVIQYRYKLRLRVAGEISTDWSDWQYIPFVKEGEGALKPPPEANGPAS